MTTQVSSTITTEVISGPWPGRKASVSDLHEEIGASPNGSKKVPMRETRSQPYKHASAVHKEEKISCLTQGQGTYPSFVGFRNLMILVIRKSSFYRLRAQETEQP